MSAEETVVATTGESTLRREFNRHRHPIHRVRYGDLCLVEEHVHVEAITVRDGPANKTTARGIRFLLRAQPVEELGRSSRAQEFEPNAPSRFAESWLDPVHEGPPHQHSVCVFVDLGQVDQLLAGVSHLLECADHWRTAEVYSSAEWREAVFAWDETLVLGVVYRSREQRFFVESRAEGLHFRSSAHRLGDLRRWLKRSVEILQAAP